jgi:hypothetical protein
VGVKRRSRFRLATGAFTTIGAGTPVQSERDLEQVQAQSSTDPSAAHPGSTCAIVLRSARVNDSQTRFSMHFHNDSDDAGHVLAILGRGNSGECHPGQLSGRPARRASRWPPPCRPRPCAADLAVRVELVKVSVDAAPRLAGRFDVRAIPTLMVLRDGQLAVRWAGAAPGCAGGPSRPSRRDRDRRPAAPRRRRVPPFIQVAGTGSGRGPAPGREI